MNDKGYNLVTNNCADATRKVLEAIYQIKMNPWLFTTPGDVKDFLRDFGYAVNTDGTIVAHLNEEQTLRAIDAIDKWKEKTRHKREKY